MGRAKIFSPGGLRSGSRNVRQIEYVRSVKVEETMIRQAARSERRVVDGLDRHFPFYRTARAHARE